MNKILIFTCKPLKRTIFYILFLNLIVFGSKVLGQQNNKGFYIKGFVMSSDTVTIPLANIQNISNGNRYISNRYGAFGINVSATDTLAFSVIGYQTFYLPVKKYADANSTEPIKVKLKPTSYKLREVEINYNKRKRDSIATVAANILKYSPLYNDYDNIYSFYQGSTGGALSSLLSQGNKKVQEYEKLMRLITLYREQQKVDDKYNLNLIERTTGLDNENALKLKKYCNLPNYFVLNSREYDLVLAIKNCFEEYKLGKR